MPYIPLKRRGSLRNGANPTDAGELTYVIQQKIKTYLDTGLFADESGPRYSDYVNCLGVLEGVKADLIRRKLNPYEERKQKENGDVW